LKKIITFLTTWLHTCVSKYNFRLSRFRLKTYCKERRNEEHFITDKSNSIVSENVGWNTSQENQTSTKGFILVFLFLKLMKILTQTILQRAQLNSIVVNYSLKARAVKKLQLFIVKHDKNFFLSDLLSVNQKKNLS